VAPAQNGDTIRFQMKIAIVGVGGIGSTFAVQLARAGHEVTVVARRRRLDQLQRAGGIQSESDVVPVSVAEALPGDVAFDLVLVTVLAHQLEPLLAPLGSSAARSVMFMFNTFASLTPLRDVVGASRFSFGFPLILAQVDGDGVLHAKIQTKGLRTTVTDPRWADVFTSAGIPSVVTADPESWLRSHAAAVVPVMLAAAESHRTRHGIPWKRATELAGLMSESFALVRTLGNDVIPASHAVMEKLPRLAVAGLLWGMSRSSAIRASGAAGLAEPQALARAMLAVSSVDRPGLRRVTEQA